MSKSLASLKEVLCGTGDKEPHTEAVAQLAQELYNTDLLITLIANLHRIDFEVLLSAVTLCVMQKKKYWFTLCRHQIASRSDNVSAYHH